ncbi:hypothetical protein TRFO_09032 [Tritrichomonas foetus]|uniref:Initiator binding domain-containing protein n=1 Tax=Tritrichomonas foetus TaxID=1144522 RepID=A0A1J4JIL5_9EUKA|nr:hypothetical protein TRFO_09032 [Tritrichomonas foetus]|eukprot:OHS98175.1 hypothetical protein TRFO_09032 [Tritrichomonas foetus]
MEQNDAQKELEQFRNYINGNEDRMKMIHIVWHCLKLTSKYPQLTKDVGAFWTSDNCFIFNSTIFGKFTNRKPNTINRNFREHGFLFEKSTAPRRAEIFSRIPDGDKLPDQIHWVFRWADSFNQSTSEREAMKWQYQTALPKNKKRDKIDLLTQNEIKVDTQNFFCNELNSVEASLSANNTNEDIKISFKESDINVPVKPLIDDFEDFLVGEVVEDHVFMSDYFSFHDAPYIEASAISDLDLFP